MIKKLANEKLARHISYHGVVLTDLGEMIALKVKQTSATLLRKKHFSTIFTNVYF